MKKLVLPAAFIVWLVLLPFFARGQNATPNPTPTPDQQAAKLKEKWTRALTDAIRDFQGNNDQESADFASRILASLDQPDGMSPVVLAADVERINNQVRQLVRTGALESAATFQNALYVAGYTAGSGPQPKSAPKTGGAPGPGGLVLYLPFDRPDQDGVIHDESGAGNDGRVFGAQWVANGKFGGTYQFHLTNLTDRIVIPNSDTLNPYFVTVTAWIKTADRDGFWNRIVDKDCRNGYCLDLGGDFHNKAHRGRLEVETSRGGIESNRVFNDNQWHHIAGVFDGQKLSLYVDGVGGARPPVKNPGPLKKNGWDLCIGNSVVDYGTGEFLAFDGLIDEVRVYNRALSADEIKTLANADHAGADLVSSPSDAAPKPDAAERLKKLQSLYDQGLINKDDFEKKKKEIMDSL